jgi:uncharacterized protein (DUF433 family)/DNA-binding transcriptional MerR regulator
MSKEWQGFYSTTQVSRIAQVPLRTLYDWKARGIIKPSVLVMDNNLLVLDGYSYADLAIIKILRALREDQIDLSSAGVALRHLWERLGPPSRGWADAHVYLVGKRIYAEKKDEWETTAATQFGQKVETRVFGELFQELKKQEEEGSILVPTDFRTFVEIDPKVMGGQPVVRGTRVPTSILAMLKAQGKSLKELTRLYSPIPKGAIEKAIEYEDFLDKATA